jgi:hypothetical protein
LEWENEKTKPSSVEEMKNRPREYTYGTKEETFLWAYETIFDWLDINFDDNHKEQFWKAMDHQLVEQENQKTQKTRSSAKCKTS